MNDTNKQIDDGGFAFPFYEPPTLNGGALHGGLTALDAFALQTMHALLQAGIQDAQNKKFWMANETEAMDGIARASYRMAKAMLKARQP